MIQYDSFVWGLNENFRNLDMSPLLQLSHLICTYAYTNCAWRQLWHNWCQIYWFLHVTSLKLNAQINGELFLFEAWQPFGHIHFHCMAKSRMNGLPNICFVMRGNNDRTVIFWVSLMTFLHSHMSMSAFLHWQTQSLLVTCLWTPSLWAQWTWAGYF